ncbi:hypothetical protein [Streptomyces tropicalis]|uniref:Uncharacterized protein n=1 Tax=Streptomyces tropicalis TaxID=3034234 RepID=A0ABT6A9Z0_9ACTN|nr:hypothetical protein [Streptomyces tropicalis]MDF3301469.1 hypothetical protein [Streptomyces tropicalis]
MSEQQGRDWRGMTPGDFDLDEPLCLAIGGGPVAIPAEPDACGTDPLFGDEPAKRAAHRVRRTAPPAVRQDRLF